MDLVAPIKLVKHFIFFSHSYWYEDVLTTHDYSSRYEDVSWRRVEMCTGDTLQGRIPLALWTNEQVRPAAN